MNHFLLALACLALLGVIAAQDFLYIPLRNETISAGLTGPYHWWLDAAYVPLAVMLCLRFHGWPAFFASISAVALIAVAFTNTAHRLTDKLTDGQHALWHSRFTLVVFLAALLLQVVSNRHGWQWKMTTANVLIPLACYLFFHFRVTTIKGVTIAASPAAEKLYVLWLCLWLIAA